MEKAPAIMFGTGGWDHGVFDSCFYPNPGMDSLHKLNYYSRYFDTVEVRPTFWDESLSETDARGWMTAVAENKRFQFNVKLHSSFTHQKSIKPNTTRNVRGRVCSHVPGGVSGSTGPLAMMGSGSAFDGFS